MWGRGRREKHLRCACVSANVKKCVSLHFVCMFNSFTQIRTNVFVFACAQVHECATVLPEGSFVVLSWFMSMCYGLGWLTRDWLKTEGQPAASQ